MSGAGNNKKNQITTGATGCHIEGKLQKAAVVNSAVATMEATLISSKMSKNDIKKAISLLGAKYGLLIVPMYLSSVLFGAQSCSQKTEIPNSSKHAVAGGGNAPAVWKKDPDYLKLKARRDEIVGYLKQTADEAIQQTFKNEIASLNVAMKDAKIKAREREVASD
ncbi:uncharacterized protein PHALS_00922 [Plasmopara halstedii]|uniref:Uncharacterized protein n=1 Tax=Plasmopara halstedii TaxID=4781 RepID=A0A0N7L6L0_PLAHL|nr:uncharacterized protein PHALS_00922 [Plasmopara halstedii]CEG44571.1 hypothetical protein PHALS_00922 [Plasmopara halstedii]|eukprot:XP_024580940.1 hypothetical protein PHALS_00922 [Plasmopara halstedii]